MIILYLIGILCSLVLFAPSIIPSFVKWPVALLVVLVVVFIFNLTKKDSIYVTHDTKKRLHDYGLFNPLIMYLSASTYILGFTLIASHLKENNVNDIIGGFNDVIGLIKPEFDNALFWGLILVVASVIIYYIRNGFKKYASDSSLKFRSFWYIILTAVSLLLGVFSLVKYSAFDLYEYLANGYNLYLYLGIAGFVVLIELLIKLIIVCAKRSKAKKLANIGKPIVVKPVKVTHKPTFVGTFVKLVVTAGFYVGAMYLLDKFYPNYAEVANLSPLYFGIGFAAILYVLHITDLLRIAVFTRSCKMKRSRFLLFIYDLLVLVGLAGFLTVILVALISILGTNELVLGTFIVRYLYIAIAVLVIQYLVIVITVANKAKHRYLAAMGGFLILDGFVKEKKVINVKKRDKKTKIISTEREKIEHEIDEIDEQMSQKEIKHAEKLAKKEAKKAIIIEKERKRIEKKLAKKEAKINKEVAKVEKQIVEKLEKLEKQNEVEETPAVEEPVQVETPAVEESVQVETPTVDNTEATNTEVNE